MATRLLIGIFPLVLMPATEVPRASESNNAALEAKLDSILAYLDRMNRRDRVRMVGSFVRSMLSLIPLAVFLWSLWYFANNSEDLLKKIANTAASSAAKYTQQSSQGMLDELMKKYQTK